MRMPFLKILLSAILLLHFCVVATGQVIKHSYRFYNDFLVSAPECGPALSQAQALGNCNAPGFAGNFITDTLPYCGINRTVYHTNLHWGLRYPNTSGTITDTYTVHLYVKNTSWGNGVWARIIDFSNGTSDAGIYYKSFGSSPNRCLDFYPSGVVGTCPYFSTSQYYLLTFTRNGANNKIDVYINNTLFTSYNDASGRYVGTAGTPIYIYRDDQVVACESGEANFAYLSFTNQYSSQATVNAVYNGICGIANTTNAADFTITPASSCALTQNIAVTYTGDIAPPGAGYIFNWGWDGGTVASGSGMGPYNVVWSTPGIKNITLTVTNTSCGNQHTKTKQLLLGTGPVTSITQSICRGQSYLGYSATGVYVDTFTTASGCDSIRTLNLTVKSYETVNRNVRICEGEKYTAGGASQTTTGVYYDTVITNTGCGSVIITNLTVDPVPPLNLGQDVQLCFGDSVVLNAGSFANYLWNNNSTAPTQVIRTPGLYWARVANVYNCIASDTIAITGLICKEIKIPNVFSPNNDGINDTWRIDELQQLTNVVVEVYSRWGQIVYRSKGYSKPWDGTRSGNKVPAGTYYYIINAPELKQKFTGWVLVVQ